MPRASWAAALLLAVAPTAAALSDYCPWWPAVERWGRRLHQLDYGGTSFKRRGIQFEATPHGIAELRSRDNAGKPWSVTLGLIGMGGQHLYAFDFDRNGREDYLFGGYTGGNGMAPPRWLQIVMIDSQGRPVVWRRAVYIQTEKMYVSDFNRDGRLELTDTQYGASNRDNHHYWTSTLYEARNAHWHLISGAHGQITSPQFTQFTHDANRRPFRLTADQEPVVANLSTVPSFESPVTLAKWQDGDPAYRKREKGEGDANYGFRLERLQNPQLTFSNGETCFIGNDAEVVLEEDRNYSWIDRPTRQSFGTHPLDVTVTRYHGQCRIERIVIHAGKR